MLFRGLLSSWATPLVRVPRAVSFSVWITCSLLRLSWLTMRLKALTRLPISSR